MPGGDRTGPAGLGFMTGRRAGYCAGFTIPGFVNPIMGRGFGRGRGHGGWGRGWRHWYYATGIPGWARAQYGYPSYGAWGAPYGTQPTPQEEIGMLNEQAQVLQEQLAQIQDRLQSLEKAQTEEGTDQ